MKRSVAVTIAGHKISLKSDADEAYVQLLADCVDERIRELQRRSLRAGLQEAAVLAALQLADDLFRERRRRSELRRKVRSQAKWLLAQLPSSLQEPGLPAAGLAVPAGSQAASNGSLEIAQETPRITREVGGALVRDDAEGRAGTGSGTNVGTID